MKTHLYVLCYRFEALVASHLEPEAFGLYMAVGAKKNTKGNVMFFEIDPGMKSDFFDMSPLANGLEPHADSSPKKSKYISVYRVLEHLDLSSIMKLYLVTADGRVMSLESVNFDPSHEDAGPNLYQELCPVSPMVVSELPPVEFLQFLTDPKNPLWLPRLFFADMLLDQDSSGRLAGYLPYQDPMHILDCIHEVEQGADKKTKTVSRAPFLHGFFRTIRRGFFLGDAKECKFYRFPERRVLEVEHARWWRSASESLQ
jgi:hypothetical protein